MNIGAIHKQFVLNSLMYFVYIFSVVAQTYNTYAHEVHVILGNSALVKCDIPSFVADFVSVISWLDNDGIEYFRSKLGTLHNLDDKGDTQAILSWF